MAIALRKINSFGSFARINCRALSYSEKDIKKSVYISQSKDIYTNLALQDWLRKNFDFTKQHLLMVWQNDPCVTIGINQNPWLEANISELPKITENGTKLARRQTEGEAMYNDQGSLNLTFFTSNEHYDRNYNLQVISRALFRDFGFTVKISPENNLTIRGRNVSGCSSKITDINAMDQCTLFVRTNKVDYNLALQNKDVGIQTNTPDNAKDLKIKNLSEDNPNLTNQKLLKAIGWEFMRTSALAIKDGGLQQAYKQNGFQMVNPTDQWFPGLKTIRDNLISWDWCYGKTPKFTISRTFQVPEYLNSNGEAGSDLSVTMVVENGRIADVTLYISPGLSSTGFIGEANVITHLKGCKFSHESLEMLESSLGSLVTDNDRFVTNCLKQVMTSA